MMNNNKSEQTKVRGVGCDVVSCRFHGPEDTCHAGSINVESHSAVRKAETFCGTFEVTSAE